MQVLAHKHKTHDYSHRCESHSHGILPALNHCRASHAQSHRGCHIAPHAAVKAHLVFPENHRRHNHVVDHIPQHKREAKSSQPVAAIAYHIQGKSHRHAERFGDDICLAIALCKDDKRHAPRYGAQHHTHKHPREAGEHHLKLRRVEQMHHHLAKQNHHHHHRCEHGKRDIDFLRRK